MEAMGTIGGGAIVVKKYQAGTTMATAGIPVIGSGASATDLASVEPMTTSTALTACSVGISLDTTGTVAATGITDTNDIIVSVGVNPDMIIKCKMNAGATEDTALSISETSAADATGVTATGATSLTEGIFWGYDGANKGIMRRTDNAAGSVSINFENGIASGDRFLYAGAFPCASLAAGLFGPDLTTLLTQGIAQTAVPGDNDNFQTFDVILGTEDNDGANNSFWMLVQNQSVFGSTQQSN